MIRIIGSSFIAIILLVAINSCGGGGGNTPNSQAVWDNFMWDDGSAWQ